MNAPGEELSSFCRVGTPASRKGLVFGVVQEQIVNIKPGSKSTGIAGGAVVFFIRLEALSVRKQAECLTKQPIRAPGVALSTLIVWLITQTCQSTTIRELETEPELLSLGGTNIEGGCRHTGRGKCFSIRQGMQQNIIVKVAAHLHR